MSLFSGAFAWRATGATVCGAAHSQHGGTPNQDAIDWLPHDMPSSSLVMAASDGHGSDRCFRSEIGSQFAVDSALHVLGDFIHAIESNRIQEDDLGNVRLLNFKLAERIVQRWQESVDSHALSKPFDAGQAHLLRLVPEFDAETQRERARIAYGATLLAVAVTQTFLLYVQLGDGDIVTVWETETASSEPGVVAPEDNSPPRQCTGKTWGTAVGTFLTVHSERVGELIANETTSLCMPNAPSLFRVQFERLCSKPPALILVSTDGFFNSFQNEDGFLRFGPDVLVRIGKTGNSNEIDINLPGWLDAMTKSGSGDDISLGIICRVDEDKIGSLKAESPESGLIKTIAKRAANWISRRSYGHRNLGIPVCQMPHNSMSMAPRSLLGETG